MKLDKRLKKVALVLFLIFIILGVNVFLGEPRLEGNCNIIKGEELFNYLFDYFVELLWIFLLIIIGFIIGRKSLMNKKQEPDPPKVNINLPL